MTFEAWMQQEQYAPATRRMTRCLLDALRRDAKVQQLEAKLRHSPHALDAARRYGRYLEVRGGEPDAFDKQLQRALEMPRPRRKLRRARKHEAVSHDEQDWAALSAELRRRREPEAAVVLVIVATGLRIGDVLRLRKESLGKALAGNSTDVVTIQKGGLSRRLPVEGARAEWRHLHDSWTDGATVWEWICPTSRWGAEAPGGAYQRVRRYLRSVAAELKLDGRPYLHRLRRTVAVRGLEITKDLHVVQQLLGHSSIRSTQTYTDELRSREVAALQQRLLGNGGSDARRGPAAPAHQQEPGGGGREHAAAPRSAATEARQRALQRR